MPGKILLLCLCLATGPPLRQCMAEGGGGEVSVKIVPDTGLAVVHGKGIATQSVYCTGLGDRSVQGSL